MRTRLRVRERAARALDEDFPAVLAVLPPCEGHHREYTGAEMKWMLETVGCDDVELEFVDYNMLQFDELGSEPIECLAAIIADPTQSDTLLAIGRRPVASRANSSAQSAVAVR
jgi:hypothetical protein